MIIFFKIFLMVFIKQVIFLVTFGFSISINSDGIFFVPVVLLVLYLIFYFKYLKKIYNHIKLDKNLFSLYYFISWLIIGGLISYLIFTDSWLWNILPKTTGMFSGLEYILVPILLVVYLVVLVTLKLIIYAFLYLKKFFNKKKNTKVS